MRIAGGTWLAMLAFYLNAGAQQPVPAEKERHHKVVFENDYLRILDGRMALNDTTPLHTHSANGVVVFLSGSTFGIQVPGGQPVSTTVKPGDLRYVDYGDKPVTHIVWDAGPASFHFLVVELKKNVINCPVAVVPGLHVEWRRPAITAYSWDREGGLRLQGQNCAWLVIDISRDGQFSFFPPQSDVVAREDHRYVLLQF